MKSARISRKKFCNPPSRRVSAFESRSWPPPMTRRAGLRTNSSVFMAQTIHGRILRCCTGSMRTATKLSKNCPGAKFLLSFRNCRSSSTRWFGTCSRICGSLPLPSMTSLALGSLQLQPGTSKPPIWCAWRSAPPRNAARRFTTCCKRHNRRCRSSTMGSVERQVRLWRLQHVVKRRAAFLGGALRQAHQIGGFEVPGWSCKDPSASDVIEGRGNDPQIREHVPNQRVLEDRQFRNDKRNFAPGQFFDNLVPVRMLPVQHRKILPWMVGAMKTLEFVRNPARLVIGGGQLRDSNALTLRLGGLQSFFREIRADFILRNHLRGHSQDIRRRTVIFRKRHAIRSRIRARLPPGKSFQEKLEASERSAAEAVDGLVVVAHHQDVARLGRKE